MKARVIEVECRWGNEVIKLNQGQIMPFRLD